MPLSNSSLLIATRNRGKVHEFQSLLAPYQVNVMSLHDVDQAPQIEENGVTFQENAWIKAQMIAKHFRVPVLADDSGLCVEALQGKPGVKSARFAGEHATDEQNNRMLLEMLAQSVDINQCEKLTDSNFGDVRLLSPAYFACALVMVDERGHTLIQTQGRCDGLIINHFLGNYGFGYDPLFYLPFLRKTMAQCTPQEKNQHSHRAKAIQLFLTEWN